MQDAGSYDVVKGKGFVVPMGMGGRELLPSAGQEVLDLQWDEGVGG